MKRYRDVELSSDERYEQMLVERAEAEAKAQRQHVVEDDSEPITVEEELVYETEEMAETEE